MKQKDYKLEIIINLLKSEIHSRRIAKEIHTNPMMIGRKINELLKENVVDFIQEGKNKKFFLKKTTEARNYVFITEFYKLIQLLRKYSLLRNIIEKIQGDKRITLAILFGSYAKGLADKNSDIDIYIETENKSLKKELMLYDSKLSIKIGRYNKETSLIKEIEKNHVIIKGVEKYYEKNKFFD